MNELSILLLGGVISVVVQVGKKYLPNINPLFFVAILALLVGLFKAVLMPLVPVEVLGMVGASFASAVAYYEVFKSFKKSL